MIQQLTTLPPEATPDAPVVAAVTRLPAGIPHSWYLLCRSADVRPGRVVPRELAGRAVAVFRSSAGRVCVMAAHCGHMGAHLGRGAVVNGDCLQCPLHHRTYDADGACRSGGPGTTRQAVFPVCERYGNVFAFNAGEAPVPLPHLAEDGDDAAFRTATTRPVLIRAPWPAVVANAFDMQHLNAVHGRALRERPAVERLGGHEIRLRYVSRVTGRGLPDRVMKWLSGDVIRVSITCRGGTLLTVDSDVGRARSHLLLSVAPQADGTSVARGVVGMRRSAVAPLDALRVAVSSWLFASFLTKDVSILEGMRFCVPDGRAAGDEPLQQFLTYLAELPRDAMRHG